MRIKDPAPRDRVGWQQRMEKATADILEGIDKLITLQEEIASTEEQPVEYQCPFCKKSELQKVEKPDIWYWACPHCDSTYNSGHFANTEEQPCEGCPMCNCTDTKIALRKIEAVMEKFNLSPYTEVRISFILEQLQQEEE